MQNSVIPESQDDQTDQNATEVLHGSYSTADFDLTMHRASWNKLPMHATRHMKNTVVGVVITLNDIMCKPATTHGQGEIILSSSNEVRGTV